MEDYKIHAIVINKKIPLKTATKKAEDIAKGQKFKLDETEESYRFDLFPKSLFDKFRSKQVNPDITLVFGRVKTSKKTVKNPKKKKELEYAMSSTSSESETSSDSDSEQIESPMKSGYHIQKFKVKKY
jgi:hypothetical protein